MSLPGGGDVGGSLYLGLNSLVRGSKVLSCLSLGVAPPGEAGFLAVIQRSHLQLNLEDDQVW